MGGYGFPSRQWGLSTDNVASVEAVLPNGTIADVSKDSYPDLFWGIQGAANAFAIVTKYNMKTFQAPSEATHYMYTWQLSADDAAKGMQSWQDFVNSDIPAELGTQITYGKGSSKGQVTFSFTGAYYGSSDSFNATIEPFLDQMPDGPSRDVTQGSWIDIVTKLSNGQPLDTSSEENYHDTFYAKSLMIPALNDDAGSAWISYMANEGYDSETAWFVQQELYGGSNSKINEVAADATAFAHRSALATVQVCSSLPTICFEHGSHVDGVTVLRFV